MRKVLISLAAAGATLAIATPAAAQYYPQYGAQYGYNYAYNSRAQLQSQLQQIRISADNLSRTGRLTGREGRDLINDIRSAERQLYRAGYISPNEARVLNEKMARIRWELRRYSDYDYGRRGYGYNGYNGYNGYGYNGYNGYGYNGYNGYYDRDRDGRDDRYEDDRGYQRDR